MSKVLAYYHIVFCTKSREMTIPMNLRDEVYRFIWNEIKQLNCSLVRIGGIPNHIHMLVNLHPTVSLSQLMQNVKGRTSSWMGRDNRFRHFKGWASDYFACTISAKQIDGVVSYIKNQDVHHLGKDFNSELLQFHQYFDIAYDERLMR